MGLKHFNAPAITVLYHIIFFWTMVIRKPIIKIISPIKPRLKNCIATIKGYVFNKTLCVLVVFKVANTKTLVLIESFY